MRDLNTSAELSFCVQYTLLLLPACFGMWDLARRFGGGVARHFCCCCCFYGWYFGLGHLGREERQLVRCAPIEEG